MRNPENYEVIATQKTGISTDFAKRLDDLQKRFEQRIVKNDPEPTQKELAEIEQLARRG